MTQPDSPPEWTDSATPATPHDFQERVAATMLEGVARRRIVDARLWSIMTQQQQQAALQIALAYEVMSRGLGYVLSNWERVPGCTSQEGAVDFHSRLIGHYIDWTKQCHARDISHAMVIDILVFGLSLTESDAARRLRKGASRVNLMGGLDIYGAVRGWR